MAGAGLLVIYSDPTLPTSTITVNHGVEFLGAGNTSASTFAFPLTVDSEIRHIRAGGASKLCTIP